MFHKMPIILIAVILAVLFLSPYIPLEYKQILLAVSLTIKSVIILILPFIIFGLLFKTAASLAERATFIIGLIVVCVCCSNACATFLSHYVGEWVYHFNLSLIMPKDDAGLVPAWSWAFPRIIANDKAMLIGVLSGIIVSRTMPNKAKKIADILDSIISKILTGLIIIIPVFIAGFVVKLQYDGVINTIVKDYAGIFALIALAQFSYVLLAYFALSQFNVRETFCRIKNILPAAITGFTTMSSASVMPLTIAGVERNTKNKGLAASVVPATVNIHLLGDCIAIPIFAYAVMKSYGMPEPALWEYIVFVFYFVAAKFSVAAIPGGGIIVMLPILESCLGFNGEMLSFMTAIYILFDPVVTSVNVLGNGAFANLIDKLSSFKFRKQAIPNGLQDEGA